MSILSFSFPSEYSTTGFKISIVNLGNKVIKYCYATIDFYNPVDDKIGTKTVTMVGPVKPNESGSYSFDHVLYSHVMDSGKIVKLKVQYFDGTIKTIIAPTIGKIVWPFEDENEP